MFVGPLPHPHPNNRPTYWDLQSWHCRETTPRNQICPYQGIILLLRYLGDHKGPAIIDQCDLTVRVNRVWMSDPRSVYDVYIWGVTTGKRKKSWIRGAHTSFRLVSLNHKTEREERHNYLAGGRDEEVPGVAQEEIPQTISRGPLRERGSRH